MTTFDFENGPAKAHRHKNPDGSEGGWVADTATVDSTAYVGLDAQIFDRAQVRSQARIYDRAQVYDRAHVLERARVYGQSQVSGCARVYGLAEVFGRAHVFGSTVIGGASRISNAVLYVGYYDSIHCGQTPDVITLNGKRAIVVNERVIIDGQHKTLEEWDREPPPHWDQLRPHVVLMLPKPPLPEGVHFLDQVLDLV